MREKVSLKHDYEHKETSFDTDSIKYSQSKYLIDELNKFKANSRENDMKSQTKDSDKKNETEDRKQKIFHSITSLLTTGNIMLACLNFFCALNRISNLFNFF